MTTISIQDLQTGSDLIFDEETYLNELTDEQLLTYKGGATPTTVIATVVAFSASGAASYLVTRVVKSFF